MMLTGDYDFVPNSIPPVPGKVETDRLGGSGDPGYRLPSPGRDFRRASGPVRADVSIVDDLDWDYTSGAGYHSAPQPSVSLPAQPPAAPRGAVPYQAAALQLEARLAINYVSEGLPEGSLARQLMAAAITGNATTLALLLARNDVLPDFAGKGGVTPLMAASALGHAKAVALLAAHPLVNVGRADDSGWTALHFAAARGHGETVALLLKHQAPVEAATKTAKTAFDLAAGSSAEDIFWQNPDFRRHMATIDRGHPKLPGKPALAR